MFFRLVLSVGTVFSLISAPLVARQRSIVVGSELDDYIRLLELDGKVTGAPLVFRPLSARQFLSDLAVDSSHTWSDFYPFNTGVTDTRKLTVEPIHPTVGFIYNSKYPRTGNDGALWSGNGISASISGGARVTWGPLTGTLFPTIYASQNRDFVLAPITFNDRTEFAYPWSGNIDWPQRFGNDAVKEFDLGQSGIRLDLGAFTAGVSTENLWWGPAIRNPIIMSNAGPGFPHVDLGTGRPVHTSIGYVEVRAIWGELRESDFFDTDPDNQRRYITGLTLGYQPNFLPGLTIGATRILYQTWPVDGLGTGEIFDFLGEFFNTRRDTLAGGQVANDPSDQMLSVVTRWLLPESGFDFYVEWARGDFSGSLFDFVLEPDHSRAYTFGFQKTLSSAGGRFRLRGEHTTLGRSATEGVRANPTYYTHHIATQGYTHKGQLVAAHIGPAGQSQFIGLDRYYRTGRWSLSFSRVRFNDDYFFATKPPARPHDTELTWGLSTLWFLPNVDLETSVEISRRLNWNFILKNHVTNVKVGLRLGWRGN